MIKFMMGRIDAVINSFGRLSTLLRKLQIALWKRTDSYHFRDIRAGDDPLGAYLLRRCWARIWDDIPKGSR